MSLSAAGASDRPVIGRIERRAPAKAEVVPIRTPVSDSKPAVAERSQEAASA
ncbi:MAG TPA: hypothetical protein VJW96_10615 [Terriglobales bacterium]|nr:hypothetical protein [Terriglobales bacterium]